MYHTCPINPVERTGLAAVNRFVRVTDVLDEPAATEYSPLSRYIYTLPMHALTEEEKHFLRDIDDELTYCITAAAVVLCRMLGTKPIRQKLHGHFWDISGQFQKIIGTETNLRHRDVMYLIAYIHNQLHNGPATNLTIPPQSEPM